MMKLIRFLLQSSRGMKHARIVLAIVIACGVVSGLTNTALLALINTSLRNSEPGSPGVVWSFVGFCILLPLARFISEVSLVRLASGTIFDLRMRLCRRILSAPMRVLEELGTHRLMATLTDDIPSISGALTTMPLLCMHAAIIFGCLVYLGWLSPPLLLGVLCFMAVAIVSYQLAVTRAMFYFKRVREQWDMLFKDFRSLAEGTKELKLHRRRREAFLSEVLWKTAQSLRRDQVTGNTIYNGARSWGQVLVFVLIGFLLFVVPNASQHTRGGYVLIILYLLTPLEVILHSIPSLGRAQIAVEKVDSLGLLLPAEGEDSPSQLLPEETASDWKKLELKGVTHTYYCESEDDNFMLGPIDLTFRPGELVFITGGNGSGKTTLVKLLVGLYKQETGEIAIDNVPVTEQTRDDYCQNFSVVFSDFHVFERLLGLGATATDARAEEYLRQLHLAHKVKVEDGVLSTTELSFGQRKRLALLTAYLEDRSCYVFDEWASGQDPSFKEIFYYQLLPELKRRHKAVIVVSHDEAYYHVADRIAKLNYGKLEFDRPNNNGWQSRNDITLALSTSTAAKESL